MRSEYLTGVPQKLSSFPMVFILGNGHDIWYAASYKDVKSHPVIKKQIVEWTNQVIGRDTSLGDWEWHHVVETQHMSQIIDYDLYQEEWYNMPTILISHREHRYFCQNFNNSAFRELATIGVGRKASPVQSRTTDRRERERSAARIDHLHMMYQHLYMGYPTLRKIADNVFEYQRRRLI